MNKKIKKYMEEIHKTEQKIADLQQYLKGLHAALKQEEDNEMIVLLILSYVFILCFI